MSKKHVGDIAHLFGATRYSLAGLARAWREEQAFRHEVVVLATLAVLLFATGKSLGLSLLTLAAWLLVMVAELLNSAVENAFDLITEERNDRVKAGKDMASAAIFLAILANAALWIVVFFVMD